MTPTGTGDRPRRCHFWGGNAGARGGHEGCQCLGGNAERRVLLVGCAGYIRGSLHQPTMHTSWGALTTSRADSRTSGGPCRRGPSALYRSGGQLDIDSNGQLSRERKKRCPVPCVITRRPGRHRGGPATSAISLPWWSTASCCSWSTPGLAGGCCPSSPRISWAFFGWSNCPWWPVPGSMVVYLWYDSPLVQVGLSGWRVRGRAGDRNPHLADLPVRLLGIRPQLGGADRAGIGGCHLRVGRGHCR